MPEYASSAQPLFSSVLINVPKPWAYSTLRYCTVCNKKLGEEPGNEAIREHTDKVA